MKALPEPESDAGPPSRQLCWFSTRLWDSSSFHRAGATAETTLRPAGPSRNRGKVRLNPSVRHPEKFAILEQDNATPFRPGKAVCERRSIVFVEGMGGRRNHLDGFASCTSPIRSFLNVPTSWPNWPGEARGLALPRPESPPDPCESPASASATHASFADGSRANRCHHVGPLTFASRNSAPSARSVRPTGSTRSMSRRKTVRVGTLQAEPPSSQGELTSRTLRWRSTRPITPTHQAVRRRQ
jgi:hypothetical protein